VKLPSYSRSGLLAAATLLTSSVMALLAVNVAQAAQPPLNDVSRAAPVVSSQAVIGGTARVGFVGSCDAIFTGADSVSFQWFRGTKAIEGAAKWSYKFASADFQQMVKCRATGTNTDGDTSTTSVAVKVAVGEAPVVTTAPTLTGSAKVGKTLTVNHGVWSPAASGYKYQWLRNGKAISGQTSKTYKAKASDAGKDISCQVTASKKGLLKGVATTASKTIKS
jgi:hypothetical protein